MKILCWSGYAIPIADEFIWIAWDKNGDVFAYIKNPIALRHSGHWSVSGAWYNKILISNRAKLEPPQNGEWFTQLYWIGDGQARYP